MFFKRFFLFFILLISFEQVMAGGATLPPPSLPSGQQSILNDCIQLGISQGLTNQQIDALCSTTTSGLPFTLDRPNQFIGTLTSNLPFGPGSAGRTDPDRAVTVLEPNAQNQGLNAGHSLRDIDQFRNDVGGTTPFTFNETVLGNTESDIWFVSANIDGF